MANLPTHRLAAWFASPAGTRVLREEVGPLAGAVRRAHGDTLLWLGCPQIISETLRGCMVRRRLYGSVAPGCALSEIAVLQCAYEALPVPNNSLDALVLHHALETAQDPRGVLREAARTLAPGGRLIICMFNPFSLWGLRRLYARMASDAFTGLHLLSVLRLLDWLALLGLEIQGPPQYLQYGLPFDRRGGERLSEVAGNLKDDSAPVESGIGEGNAFQQLLQRRRLPLGGVCLLSATKQAVAVRPHWGPAVRLATVGYANPAFGNSKVIPLHLPKSRLPTGE